MACRFYYGLIGLISFLLSTLIVQSLKRMVFYDTMRPSKFFADLTDLYYVDGLTLHSYFSFPSGHSSGAFTMFLAFALFVENQWLKFACFVFALLVAFSRVYLMQHFFIDTYFGALIAVIITLLVYSYFHYRTNLKNHSMLQRNFFRKGGNQS